MKRLLVVAALSDPSNSIDSCAAVSRTTPSAGEGQMSRRSGCVKTSTIGPEIILSAVVSCS